MKKFTLTFLSIILLAAMQSFAQFYNGHQMNFGKNRVQYNDFYWSYYRFDKFDTYFNQDGEAIARFTGEHASQEIQKLESRLNYGLNKRLIFLVYNKFSDFKQSNVGLVTGKEDYNTGGVTKIRNNKVSLYYQGNHDEYLKQMRSAIAEVMVTEMLYGNKLTDNIANSSMLNLPEWYLKGLTSYLSDEWSIDIENRVKDGFKYKRFNKFNKLTGEDAIYAGHSFWKYINDYYGSSTIIDIIYLTRVNKGANSAILNVLGLPFKDITKQWIAYYESYFNKENISNSTTENLKIPKYKKTGINLYQAKISPDGENIAYVSNEMGLCKVWIYNSETDKTEKIYKQGHKIKQINDLTYPVITWHPSGKYLTIITEEEGGLKLIQYILTEKNLTKRNLLYFDKILDLSYSDDGSKIVFSAVKKSKTDIYIYDIASATSQQITDDLADDFNPKFTNESNSIIFSSNRVSDTLISNRIKYSDQFDLFEYNYKEKNNVLSRLTSSPHENEAFPFDYKTNEFLYLNDKNGIKNIYNGKYDSTISFIDTTIHYRYFLNQNPITNSFNNIESFSFSNKTNNYTYTEFNNGKFKLYKDSLVENFSITELKNTDYRKILNKRYETSDSLSYQSLLKNETLDSAKIFSKEDNYVDINHYVFEIEKSYFNYKYKGEDIDTTKTKFAFPKIKIYQRTFYTDHIVSQVDFSFLNSAYQAFTGGAVYFNPGFNALFKIGAFDLLEDYKIIAGVRFSADFNSNEYLVSLENLKKQIDEQFVYHRQSFENTTENFVSKTLTNKLMYVRTLPFNQVRALKGTVTLRQDKQVFLSIDRSSLQAPNINKLWGGLKLEYIFDNTISTGINLYNGTRYKIFAEYYNRMFEYNDTMNIITDFSEIEHFNNDLFVIGADFRHYQKIHRDLIFAARFAASTSFGRSKLIYYLGGVDNWTNFSQQIPTFIPLNEIPIQEDETYAFQAVATNLRGFPQNIRNGNSFALINTELRWPFIKYFSNYPLNSSFWSNLQLVGFFDVGTAWSGLTPYSKENAYDKKVYDYETYVLTIDSERDPIVAGYGFGVRAMLFGYFARFDWAWGIENQKITPRIFYFSLSLDF